MNKTMRQAFALFILGITTLVAMPDGVAAAPAQTQVSPVWENQIEQYNSTYRVNQRVTKQNPLQGRVIVVDPGHGGSDTGAIGPNNLLEKNVTLNIAQELRKMLAGSGATVIMTRTSDRDVAYDGASDIEELKARVDIANRNQADIFVSIHTDAFDGSASGTTTYYAGRNSRLAQLVQNNVVSQIKLYDRGAQQNDYFVLENTYMPAILTEAAFLSNPQEAKLLTSRTFQRKIAMGIYNGIRQHFQNG